MKAGPEVKQSSGKMFLQMNFARCSSRSTDIHFPNNYIKYELGLAQEQLNKCEQLR